ncbi:DNA repair protein RecO [Sulfobacillus sp. hq2]|uniref:DNA repair protein RecO n=1 Tax=Sulfobacillus sp. hq2 TaxID=2039167 RepID=UPI000CD2EFFB|nr:DNA repair protein RecO [Sulfobacillus sp. hq2]POB11700.1 DNA repair protein RecO [Sulfobacillus sp. hq2]
MAQYQDHMLILKSRPYRESDALITAFGLKSGKIGAIAKGTRRAKNRLAGLYPLSYTVCEIYHGRSNLDTITGTDLVEGFSGMRQDLSRLSWGMLLADLVDEMWEERDAAPAVFPWVVGGWEGLAQGANALTITLTACWHLLQLAGYYPQWETCEVCGRVPDDGPVALDLVHDRLYCTRHRPGDDHLVSVFLGTWRTWRRWMELDVNRLGQYEAKGAIGAQIFTVFRRYVQSHIGRLPRSLQFLQEVENIGVEGEDLTT